jgi:hypothetical protein
MSTATTPMGTEMEWDHSLCQPNLPGIQGQVQHQLRGQGHRWVQWDQWEWQVEVVD